MFRYLLAIVSIYLLAFPIIPAYAEESIDALYNRGIQSYNTFTDESIKESIMLFEMAVLKNPDFAPGFAALSEGLVQKYFRSSIKDETLLDSASKAAEKSLFLDDKLPEGRKAIASILFAEGKIEESIKELEIALVINPDYARAWLNLGTCYVELEKISKAMELFMKAAQIKNDQLAEGIAYFNVAALLSSKNRHEETLDSYEKAAKLVPFYYNIHYGYGVALMNLNRDDEALGHFKRAALLKPDYAGAYLGIASAYHRMKNKQEATKAYEAALKIDPDLEEAKVGLMALQEKKIGCLYVR